MIGRFGRAGIVQAGVAFVMATGFAHAQVVTDAPPASGTAQQKMAGYIAADSNPYRIEWTGTGGYFVQHAYAQEPARRIQMDYLHTQVGPVGYSKHLAWFIARDTDSFNILWLYLDDAGTDFGCWLYQYPSNRLTYHRFTGNYRFTPPTSAPAPHLFEGISLRRPPHYAGLDFTFRDWTRDLGTLDRLDLVAAPPEGPVVGTIGAPPVAPGSAASPQKTPNGPLVGTVGVIPTTGAPTKAPDRTLSALRVAPLHEISVGEANGWKNSGWQELHCLAFDTSDDPYYLILYSNETTGFVIDIKHAKTYTANFGAKVQFSAENSVTQQNSTLAAQDLHVRRYDWHDFTVRSAQKHANPYTEVNLLGEFVGPDGNKVQIPGYWDGSDHWKLRFTPGLVGDWLWHTRSNDPDLDGLGGSFECVAVDGKERAFFGVHPDRSYKRHFATREGKPVFPFALHDPVFNVSPEELRANTVGIPAASDKPDLPASFVAFQKRVDAWSAQGVNRFVGGFLLDHDGFAAKTQANEGGAPFLGYDLDHPNPAFFQWMDRRIAYCNEHGIVPDIGFGWPSGGMFQTYTDVQLRRFWLSIVARYAAMDVSWNLFGDDGQPLPEGAEARISAFAELTHLYDPGQHALTFLRKGAVLPDFRVIEDSATIDGATISLPSAPVPPAPVGPPITDYPWLDYMTLAGGSTRALDLFPDLNKPIVVWADNGLPMKREAVSADITRHTLWETRMRNGYWVGSADSMAAVDSADVKMAADCAKFFRKMKWWRLYPHPEMLTGREETPAERRRRQKTEDAVLGTGGGGGPRRNPDQPRSNGRRPAGPQFLLADPGKEYVAYLERGGHITLDLIDMPGRIHFVWFNPATGQSQEQPDLEGGDYTVFVAPDKNDWVLSLSRH